MKPSGADVVVVGGGIIGSAATYYLARAGMKVELLERGQIGGGTSSRSADSLVLQSKAPGPKLTLAAESVRRYRTLGEELDADLEFRNEGGMVVAFSEAELAYVKQLVERMNAAGIQVDLLDSGGAREVNPALAPDLLAASYCELDCHINPLRIPAAFVRAAVRLGAKVRTGTEVTGVLIQNGRVRGVDTRSGEIQTPVVVNAAGIWAPAIARMAGIDLAIAPRKGQILVSEALPPLVRGRIFTAKYLMGKLRQTGPVEEADSSYSSGMSLGQQTGGNFIIGATRELAGEDGSNTPTAIADLSRQTVRLLPGLRGMRIIRAFSGFRPSPPDGSLLIRRYQEPEGFVVASGHDGDGICLAPATGEIVSEIVAGQISDYREWGPVRDSEPARPGDQAGQ